MKYSLIVALDILIYLGLNSGLTNAQFQDYLLPVQTTVNLDLSTRKQLDSLIFPNWYCNLKTTSNVFGYSIGTNKPFYERKCSGMCLSVITKPLTCQPTYKTYVLAMN